MLNARQKYPQNPRPRAHPFRRQSVPLDMSLVPQSFPVRRLSRLDEVVHVHSGARILQSLKLAAGLAVALGVAWLSIPSAAAQTIPAFPGAEGYGAYAVGG